MQRKMPRLQLLTLSLVLLLGNSATPTAAHKNDNTQKHQRLKTPSPEQLLKEFAELPLPANLSSSLDDLQASGMLMSWTGAKLHTGGLAVNANTTSHKKRKPRPGQTPTIATAAGGTKKRHKQQQQRQEQQRKPQQLQQHKQHKQHKQQAHNGKQQQPKQQQKQPSKKKQRASRASIGGGDAGVQRQKLQRNALRLLNSQQNVAVAGSSKDLSIARSVSGGLFPQPFNVATRARITVNATCGQNGREEYCKLVDAYPHKKWATQCGICNAHSSDAGKQRPIDAIITPTGGNSGAAAADGTDERWWQSPTLQYGRHFEYVTITLDLRQIYHVFSVMLKSANSPRPASWVLERSLDGELYEPWQFFGVSDADCRRRYGLAGQTGKHIFQNDTEIICTTQFSKALPLENGELHVSLLKNRPGALEQRAPLLDFIRARYIRIRLQGMHTTANLDNSVDWLLDAQSLEKRSFYSLKQLRVSARLDCNGHAERTLEVAAKKKPANDTALEETAAEDSLLTCVCAHNTCGDDCSQCCPLFHDKPYRRSLGAVAAVCEICLCHGHAERCEYDDYLARGICLDCGNGTTGNECEFCVERHYRPLGATPSEACRPCECSALGTLDGRCEPVGGACVCKEGFQGDKCEECATGYYGVECRKCECDARGTLAGTECAGLCSCKAHVAGETCENCLPGFYDLRADNADGCTECWCSGVGLTCSSAQLQTLAFETLNDWRITDISRLYQVTPTRDAESNQLIYNMEDLSDKVEAIYWQAPQGYLGNRLTSYGSRLSMRVSWVTIRGDTSGQPTSGPSVILYGRNGLKIACGDELYTQSSSTTINVTLQETSGWYHVPPAVKDIKTRLRRMEKEYLGAQVTRAQFLSVLARLEGLLIRGTYHTDQVETTLERSIIYSGGTELGGKATTQVEQCVCPPGYTGLSCEGCDFGYIRIADETGDTAGGLAGKCMPCPCNGHSNSCDLQSGGCGECQHNTYGERCERCKVGYYGNPLQGTPHDCQRCACPLPVENNFSPSCQLKSYISVDTHPLQAFGSHAAQTAEYICTQCPEGYTGDHCEMCDDGYYGNPTEPGSSCKPCECDGGPCDVFTGDCIVCSGNTEGWHCERCKIGYWGDPSMGCEPCDCNSQGSDSDVCDSTDGQCLCKPRFAGQKCDECYQGFAHIERNCEPCSCDSYGSIDADLCEPESGQCDCKPGVTGLKCNECAEGHFGLKEESNGCEDCQCSAAGALSTICDKRSGQCACLPNVGGRRCDKCQPGHWNLTQGLGCHDCRCDAAGSRSRECNPWTGQCDCKIGIGGQRCNECTEGFYGFSTEGCQRCAPCVGEGQVCDTLNGRCICPPHSRGLGCAQCVEGTWGWQPRHGCRECRCDRQGAIGQWCDTAGGQCQCREGFAGRQCDECALGYFGYPECRRCNCDVDGSFVRPSDGGVIACDANGQCPCKTLVVGLKCDTCMQSTFGISALNPEGCTRCYCFGRSAECEQSDWTWARVRMQEARNLSVQYVRHSTPSHGGGGHQQGGEYEYIVVVQLAGTQAHHEDAEISAMNDLSLVPRSTGNVSIGAYGNFRQPLYFQLPPQFHGDRISSYGGHLYFTLITGLGAQVPHERGVLARFPLVQLHAHARLVLDYYEYEEYEYGLNVTHKVPLHESYWRHHQQQYGSGNSQQTVDRATLMAALQNVRHIFVRGSAFADFTEVILQDVHMDAALYIAGATTMIARGVERCKCPKRYDGLSCQDPGKGFYRWRNTTESESVFVEDLIGRAAPCHCNSRSGECEPETGACLNCRDYTGGMHCEQCAEGFYGEPNSPHGCQACPCPETSRNFAKGCTVWQGEVSCICRSGYTGPRCDRCRAGYFGDPLAPDATADSCQPCGCQPDGITEDGCDAYTGQCNCRAGVAGRRCDKCIAERTHLTDRGCKLCDNCTLLLLDYVELIGNKLRRGMHNTDLASGAPAPYLKVEEYENLSDLLQLHLQDYNNARELLGAYDANGLLKLDSYAENTKFQSRKALTTAGKRLHAASLLHGDAATLYNVVGTTRAAVLQTIWQLNGYGQGEQHMSLPMALEEARFFLDAIREHEQSVQHIRTSGECAWEHYYRWGNASDAAFDGQARVEYFWRDLNQTNHRLSDMRLHLDRTLELQSEFDDVREHIVNLHGHVVEGSSQIVTLNNDVVGLLDQQLLPRAHELIDDNLDRLDKLGEHIESIVRFAGVLNSTLEEREGLQREVRKHWLPKAQKHASRLMERSNEYARQFQPTRNGAKIALLASSAHKNISEAIEAARLASYAAKDSVYNAQRTLYPSDGSSVIPRAQQSSHRSKLLQQQALEEMQRTNALLSQLQVQQSKVEGIKRKIVDAGVRTNDVSAQLQNLFEHSAGRQYTQASIAQARNTSAAMQAEVRRTQQMHEDIQRMRDKISLLEPEWEIKLGMAEENVSLTKTNVRLANVSLHYLEKQASKEDAKFDAWNNSVANQLQQLRDMVAKARHAAAGIKISVDSGGSKCIRSYLPTSYGLTTSNTISFSFALASRNGNSPLLYVQGSEGRYISLELYKRHIRLLWHLGGTTAVITHPLEVQTRDPKYDDAWYHVEVNRTLNLGSLLVRRMGNYGALMPAQSVMGHTDAEHTRFYQTNAERIYIGGYPATNAPAKELQLSPGLNVVAHKVEVDHKPLGLWNFLRTEGTCGGAMIGAHETIANSVARHFNGRGYAEVKKSRPRPYRKNLFALQMTFKTRDENALLFLAVDNRNNRSVSVTLSRGRIMFRIDYGDESRLEINTTNKYNTGKWIKIEAAREFVPKRGTENGILRVNSERAITGSPTVPIKSHMLPDLSKLVYYLGGVPPGFHAGTTKAPGADNPFLGCMRDVQVNGETYDPLESSSYYGVEPSCKEIFTQAGFTGSGHVELPSQSLRKRANAGFVFRTLQSDCLLLLAAYPPEVQEDYDAKDIKGNYSFTLLDGHLQVWVNSGRSLIKMSSNLTLNDGDFHVVNLIKNGRKFELYIDDELQVTQSMQGTPTVVSLPRDAGGLYFGGAPPHEEYTPLAPTFNKLEGAIRDVVFNNRTINFNDALNAEHVQIGRNGPVLGNVNGLLDVLLKTEPMLGKSFTTAPEGCLRVGSYSYEPNAFKFGDERYSYAQVQAAPQQRSFWQRNFHISFDFRSFYPSGMIFLSPGIKEKQKHYVALLLKDGQLLLIVRGRRREELQLTAKLNDGEWHHVTIQSSGDRKLTMSVEIGRTDQKTSAQMKLPRKIAASHQLFVGGLPQTLPKMPSELLMRLEPFKGCLRRFAINNSTQDLARPGKHMHVGQCFPQVERGSYFPGDAYAIYKRNFHVGKYLELELEFRTSELAGIILSISEPSGFPAISLELNNGNIIFSCDLGDGTPFRLTSVLPSKYALCDNKWHNISALYDYEQLALRIDRLPTLLGLAPQQTVGKVQTKSPLYIGGIPDVAPSGSLMSRENFKGCIRNVSIRNERRDWIDMDALHNVLLSECLVAQSDAT